MKKSRTFWSITGALGVVALGAGVAVAQPAPGHEHAAMQESASPFEFSSVDRVAESAKASVAPALSADSALSAVSAKSAVSPVSAKSAVSPVSAKSAASAVTPMSPRSAPSAHSAN